MSSVLVTLDRVTARTPDGTTLFENLSLAFTDEKVGLVGRNGAGKTTLLRLIAGDEPPYEGAITRHGRIGLLPQNLDIQSDATIAETLGIAAALHANARLMAGKGQDDDLALADWTLDARLKDAFVQVGLDGIDVERRTVSLSGGEQTRLLLARLLLAAPDMLLLDEPTNNLDADARAIVAGFVSRWRGGALIASHDRALLRAVDRIAELSSLGVRLYGGNYDLYAAWRAEERALAERRLDEAERSLARVSQDVQREKEKKARRDSAGRKGRAKAGASKMALDAKQMRAENTVSRQNRTAERLVSEAEDTLEEARADVERIRRLVFELPPSGLASGKLVLRIEDARVAIAGREILPALSLTIAGPERIGIVGPNGAGKTTLLRLIAGDIEPSTGRIARFVPAALVDQHAALLDPKRTLLENFLARNPESNANIAYAALARFLFRNVQALRRPSELSGGERLRAALACVLGGENPPQLLMLDEPTNHLDLDSIAAIESALSAYDGALIVVSHDQDFLAGLRIEKLVQLPT